MLFRPLSLALTVVFASLALSLVSAHAAAPSNDCSPVDLRGPTLGAPRDQGDTGWCFNYAAADLLDFHISKRVSVTDLGIQNHEKSPSGVLTLDRFSKPDAKIGYGGRISNALKRVRRGYVCLEDDLSSESFAKITETVARGNRSQTSANLDIKAANLEILKIKKALDAGSKPASWIAFPGLERAAFYKILKNNRADEIWENLIQASCGDRREATGHFKIDQKTSMDQALDQGKIIGIEYDAAILKSKNSSEYYPHASTVVGRRANPRTGKCELLIRNTWGEDCKGYRRDLECDRGNIWVDRAELDDVVSGTVVIQSSEL